MAEDIQILHPHSIRNRFHHVAGLGILTANLLRHRVSGFRDLRLPPSADAEESCRRDSAIVENWLHHLRRYLGGEPPIVGKQALELGPGRALGRGLFLLAIGMEGYRALDDHPSLKRLPSGFHQDMAQFIAHQTGIGPEPLLDALNKLEQGEPGRLAYSCHSPLDLSVLAEDSIDFIFSQTVLEHLEHPEKTIEQMARVARPGTILVSEIDLQTHTRWIRDADPLNIYRYPDSLYRAFSFSGIPNRVRPDDYLGTLTRHGWTRIRLFPKRVLDPEYVKQVEPTLAPQFRGDLEHLGWMSLVICATRDEKLDR